MFRKKLFLYLIFFHIFFNAAIAYELKPNNEYINDFANLINDEVEQKLYKKLHDVEHYSGVEISVATINNFEQYTKDGENWEEFSTKLFNEWGIGNIKNDGVLLLISKDDRKIRIELGKDYPSHYDQVMKSIIDNNVSNPCSAGDCQSAILAGVDEIIASTTTPISFFEWYKWQLFWIGIILLLLFFYPNPILLILSVIGFIVSFLSMGNDSEGFGGGESDGGGASGDF